MEMNEQSMTSMESEVLTNLLPLAIPQPGKESMMKLAVAENQKQTAEFQTIILLGDRDEPSVVVNAGIMACEIAKSCELTHFNFGAKGRKTRVYVCPKKLFERLNAHRDIDDFEKEHGLAKLKGSDKQIEWARVIRHHQFEEFLFDIARLKKSQPDRVDVLDDVVDGLRRVHLASHWINRRECSSVDLISFGLDQLQRYEAKMRKMEQAKQLDQDQD